MTHPDGRKDLVGANRTLSYIFSSRGKANIELGVNYTTGWISTDKVDFIVQGAINGLKLKLDSSEVSLLVKTESNQIEFHLETADQPYQIKRCTYFLGLTNGISLAPMFVFIESLLLSISLIFFLQIIYIFLHFLAFTYYLLLFFLIGS